MAERKVIWLRSAELDMFDLMGYYTEKNKSKVYSNRLYREINLKLKTLDFTVALPQKTAIKDLYYFTHNHISVFFALEKNSITAKFVIDERRNPNRIKALLK